MVTKPYHMRFLTCLCLILAKIYMVTKPGPAQAIITVSLILAKIYMVTKPQIHNSIYLKTNKS